MSRLDSARKSKGGGLNEFKRFESYFLVNYKTKERTENEIRRHIMTWDLE